MAVVLATLVTLTASSAFADSLLSVKRTPYDRQMSRITPYLQASSHRSSPPPVSLVNQWIGNLRSIPYGFSQVWKTPQEVATDPIADCKGKAVALYGKMKAAGAKNMRLVIGRKSVASRSTHAWVEWSTQGGTYVLDPTINWEAYKADRFSSNEYIPLYAFAGGKKYKAVSSSLVAKN